MEDVRVHQTGRSVENAFLEYRRIRVGELHYNFSLSGSTVVRIIQGLGLHTACP
jgi:hypothetical protein